MMMMMRSWWVVMVLAVAVLAGAAEQTPVVTRETAKTPGGTCVVWRRTPATEADLEMPLFGRAVVVESYAYRVRDRKKRDLLQYARIDLSSPRPVAEVLDFYRTIFTKAAMRETNKDTGMITFTSGVEGNCRLVTITPKPGFCDIRLERVRKYPVAPRVYTAPEQRALRVLHAVEHAYQTAGRVAYQATQTFQLNWQPEDKGTIPTLNWTVDVTRPRTVSVQASVDGGNGVKIVTRDGMLVVTRPEQPEEKRPINGPLDLTLLPELQADPVARLMLGDDLLASGVDFIDLQPAPAAGPHRERLVLTYPEDGSTLYLTIDLTQMIVLQSEVVLTGEENRRTTMLRTYTNTLLVPAAAPAPAAPAKPRSQTVPPAVTGP